MTFVLTICSVLVLAVVGRLVGTEAVTRLDGLPLVLLRWAARRLPKAMRPGQLEEWSANVHDVIYPETDGLPVTRLWRGMRFSTSALCGARRLAREVDPSLPRHAAAAYVAASWDAGRASAEWAQGRGWSRWVSNAIGYAVALHWIGIVVLGPQLIPLARGDFGGLRTLVFTLFFTPIYGVGRATAVLVGETLLARGWSPRRAFYPQGVVPEVVLGLFASGTSIIGTSGSAAWTLPWFVIVGLALLMRWAELRERAPRWHASIAQPSVALPNDM